MIVLIAVAALVVIGLAVAIGFGAFSRVSVHAGDPVSSAGGRPLPEGEFMSDDVAYLRFDTAVRGYRMDQVDAAIDRLRARLEELEAMIAEPDLPPEKLFGDAPGSIAMFPPVGGIHDHGERPWSAGRPRHDDHPDGEGAPRP